MTSPLPTTGSSIPAFIDALVATLRARPFTSDRTVAISDGYPMQTLSGKKLITIGGQAESTVTGSQMVAQLGAQRREEDYMVRVHCSAQTGGTTQKTSRDQAFALMREVEQALRSDATLGGVVRFAQVEGNIVLTQTGPDEAESGRWAEVSFDVRVQNRI